MVGDVGDRIPGRCACVRNGRFPERDLFRYVGQRAGAGQHSAPIPVLARLSLGSSHEDRRLEEIQQSRMICEQDPVAEDRFTIEQRGRPAQGVLRNHAVADLEQFTPQQSGHSVRHCSAGIHIRAFQPDEHRPTHRSGRRHQLFGDGVLRRGECGDGVRLASQTAEQRSRFSQAREVVQDVFVDTEGSISEVRADAQFHQGPATQWPFGSEGVPVCVR